jgi:hypothetical protein
MKAKSGFLSLSSIGGQRPSEGFSSRPSIIGSVLAYRQAGGSLERFYAILRGVPRGSRCSTQSHSGTLPTFLLARTVDGGVASTPRGVRSSPARTPRIMRRSMKALKLTPNLVVRDVTASLNFYRNVLEFERAFSVPDAPPYVFAAWRRWC